MASSSPWTDLALPINSDRRILVTNASFDIHKYPGFSFSLVAACKVIHCLLLNSRAPRLTGTVSTTTTIAAFLAWNFPAGGAGPGVADADGECRTSLPNKEVFHLGGFLGINISSQLFIQRSSSTSSPINIVEASQFNFNTVLPFLVPPGIMILLYSYYFYYGRLLLLVVY